jgi:hypothetical protein
MTHDLRETLTSYLAMMDSLLANEISASDFQKQYLQAIKSESRDIPNNIFEILNWLFVETDFYVEDPSLRDEGEDLDDQQLRQKVREARTKLAATM